VATEVHADDGNGVRLINQTRYKIDSIELSPNWAGEWSGEKPALTLAPRGTFDITLPDDDGCSWDIRVEADGVYAEAEQIETCLNESTSSLRLVELREDRTSGDLQLFCGRSNGLVRRNHRQSATIWELCGGDGEDLSGYRNVTGGAYGHERWRRSGTSP
jgi:hypothetical protein